MQHIFMSCRPPPPTPLHCLYALAMDNLNIGLVTLARAGVKTGLAVYLAEPEQ